MCQMKGLAMACRWGTGDVNGTRYVVGTCHGMSLHDKTDIAEINKIIYAYSAEKVLFAENK